MVFVCFCVITIKESVSERIILWFNPQRFCILEIDQESVDALPTKSPTSHVLSPRPPSVPSTSDSTAAGVRTSLQPVQPHVRHRPQRPPALGTGAAALGRGSWPPAAPPQGLGEGREGRATWGGHAEVRPVQRSYSIQQSEAAPIHQIHGVSQKRKTRKEWPRC